jgi:RNA polymerase sigma-70 factor (ECF subfamily)
VYFATRNSGASSTKAFLLKKGEYYAISTGQKQSYQILCKARLAMSSMKRGVYAMFLRDTPDDDLSSNEPSEAWLTDIVERARAREQKAFAILFDHYNAKICTYLIRLVHNESIAHDLAQNSFCKAWEKLPTINDPSCFKSWLYTIATREALVYVRCARPTEPLSSEEEEYSMPQHLIVDGPEKQVEETELIKWILAQLSLQHRTCLVLQIEGFTLREIAELVGISEKNVSVSISRAREQCRQLFRHVKGELS